VARRISYPQLTASNRYASHSHRVDELWPPADPGHLHRCESQTIRINRRSGRVHRSNGNLRLYQQHDLSQRTIPKRPLNRSQGRHRSRNRRRHHDSPPGSHPCDARAYPQTSRQHPGPTPTSRPAPLLNRHEHRRERHRRNPEANLTLLFPSPDRRGERSLASRVSARLTTAAYAVSALRSELRSNDGDELPPQHAVFSARGS